MKLSELMRERIDGAPESRWHDVPLSEWIVAAERMEAQIEELKGNIASAFAQGRASGMREMQTVVEAVLR